MLRRSFVYGPVPSRRLGLSLGVSIVPPKTCTIDCIYCQCGRTTRRTLDRESFYPVEEVISQVRAAVAAHRVEFITFSGEGEPTLNRDIGRIIRRLKDEFSIPVAVLTNGTLLTDPAVRRALYPADLVVPSLDAADERNFARVNRHHPGLNVANVIRGLVTFRRHYRGKLWLEVMLVKNINDSPEHLVMLRRAAEDIGPDRVHLNTVARPPAVRRARPLSDDDLAQVQKLFGSRCEIADSPLRRRQRRFHGDPAAAIIELARRRPVTPADITRSLGVDSAELPKLLARLTRAHRLRRVEFWGKVFYEARRSPADTARG
ncbi:MAG TPA: radical SAM protein [candidate division WOR-3 bacterium]|uniref:Radical SAM protein n=1 Tax=candidate division WOR-3 bacterium TaxID=2052148 RepID=A0A7V0XFF8_UNCW3|nr:radical SAM protein [candidate division WOR-3 bacterium]